jgi:hypothetical protein
MCSSSEDTEKSIPLIRLTKESATVESYIPLSIRPFIKAELTEESHIEELMTIVTAHADEDPVVIVKFDRQLSHVINRLHSTLDAQRAVIRCYPLPRVEGAAPREKTGDHVAELGMDHFVAKRFEDDPELGEVAEALLVRGSSDADNIMTDMIERRLAEVAVREDGE